MEVLQQRVASGASPSRPGPSSASALRPSHSPVVRAALLQVATGVAHLHGLRIVHRDLKVLGEGAAGLEDHQGFPRSQWVWIRFDNRPGRASER
jgi:serine/threonine protein kinase